MIFVAFGNSPMPFMRLAAAMDDLAGKSEEQVVVQSGYTNFPFKHCLNYPFMDSDEYRCYLRKCRIAILQGGWGGVSEASDLGCRIVAVPRRKGEEHHHDQEQLVRKLEETGVCLGCYDIRTLPEVIKQAETYDFKPIQRGDASNIINDFISSLRW